MPTLFQRLASLALVSVLALTGCVSAPQPPPAAAPGEFPKVVSPSESRATYNRCVQTEADTYVLQTGARVFKPSGKGPEIELLGAVHIGEEAYYQALQKRMDAADVVLFEQVSDEASPPEKMTKEEKAERMADSAYQKLADLMGLTVQTSHIRYERKHFERCDMSVQQMRALLEAEIAKGGPAAADAKKALKEFSKLMDVLQGDSWLLNFALWVAGLSDTIKADLKLMLVLGAGDNEEGKDKALAPRLSKLITEDRNDFVISRLPDAVQRHASARRILVFYGAAHLPGMEKSLLSLGYTPAGDVEWLNAVTSHPFAEGLDYGDVQDAIKRVKKAKKK